MEQFISGIQIVDALDIAVMAFLFYSGLVWFKKTRAAFVLRGILILGLVYLIAKGLGMFLTTLIFQGFFAIFLIAVVVIFQEELRQAFERIATISFEKEKLRRFWRSRAVSSAPAQETEALVCALAELSRQKIGALIVLTGKDPLPRHLNGGTELYGKLSEALLLSIFDPHSLGHDGAAIVEQGRVTLFATMLPLSKSFEKLQRLGTRHAAALGLSELSDALCLIVSEERGSITLARHGELISIANSQDLTNRINVFLQQTRNNNGQGWRQSLWKRNLREKIMAVTFSFALWFVLVRGSNTGEHGYQIPIRYYNLGPNLSVQEMKPAQANVILSGAKRSFYFLNPEKDIEVSLNLAGLGAGKTVIPLTVKNARFPENTNLQKIEPPKVRVLIKETRGLTHDTPR